ncbi:PIN domain nuclease [Streptomyces sp. WMMC500]|uniref:PIN domain nuclease n=1 Tax=Streptomyces sp. WMMC500 TaxID=3015154 RepID=UPI00248B9434|nr:PIN domain nuclease [Streptomyces sp. WMMC500]WBB64286.1 PIN domain nuclease [Streptomyces sp. WMMC500]
MREGFLADTSALVRFYRRQTSPGWDETVTAGLVGLCEPVRQEYLRAVGGRPDFYDADAVLHETFPYYSVPDDAWQQSARVQRHLADRGWHQSASPVDLIVAVTAAHHTLTVLHADRDVECIIRIIGQTARRID